MRSLVFLIHMIGINCFKFDDTHDYLPTGFVIANIKRREVIPIQQGARRSMDYDNLQYRKTKDIRDEVIDRHFEITESQIIEAQREANLKNALMKESEIRQNDLKERKSRMREDNVRSSFRDTQLREQGKNVGMDEPPLEGARMGIQRDSDVMQNDFKVAYIQRNNKYGEDKDRLDKLHQEMRWLTINTDEGIGIGI